MNLELSRIAYLILFVSFFIAYVGMTSSSYAIIFLMILFKIDKRIKISYYDFFFLFLFFSLLFIKLLHSGFLVGDALFRYYLGVVIIYWFVKLYDIKLDIQKLLFLFCLSVIFEAIIINVFLDPFRYLPNYPFSAFEGQIESHYTKFMGFYQRPYSIGMNASTSATILCALLMYRESLIRRNEIVPNLRLEILAGITILLFASGVGLSLYFFYLLYKFRLLTIRRVFVLFIGIVLFVKYYNAIFYFLAPDSIFQKVSAGYMNFLLEFKDQQIQNVISILKEKNNSILIGQSFKDKSEIILQSDFAWNDFFQCLGVSGLGLFFLFIFNKINKYNFFPALLFIVGAFHYGGVFTLAGQIVFALMLFNLKKEPEYESGKTFKLMV